MPSVIHKSFHFRLEFPSDLPISLRAEEITAAIQANQVLILAGETGSGKTTQIPKMCLAAGRGTQGRIGCTQPRRVAALSISRRVAAEMGVDWGREVGCKVRFNDHTSPGTVVKFVTDGMLLAEMQRDPLLREYDTLIIDEAHERSLNIDFLLGHLRGLRFKRPELKIIATSATIDTAAFSTAFDDAPVIVVEGRTFPVEVVYAPLDTLGTDYTERDENEEQTDAAAVVSARAEALHYIEGTVEAIARIVEGGTPGDVLAFLPSERDIREARDLVEGRLSAMRSRRRDPVEVIPLYGRLSNTEQQRVFAAVPRRKVILSTNIAETSLTIPGIRFVVDSGLARVSRYSPVSRTRRLPIEEISQSSAEQRKGRAGRVADGVCIRLYSGKNFAGRPRFAQPEIQRANLADVILRMKAFGLGDIERFPFLNMPATKSIRAGYALLEELGALEAEHGEQHVGREGAGDGESGTAPPHGSRRLTEIGRELARLPVDPTAGRMILQARKEKALREALIIASGLSIQDPRERPIDRRQEADAAHRRFAHPDSDFLTLLAIWNSFHEELENVSQARLRRFCRDHFLSYTRMREWRDIHGQLAEVLEQHDDFKMTSALDAFPPGAAPERPDRTLAAGRRLRRTEFETASDPLRFGGPAYRSIHRSILAGLLGNIARLDEESGGYAATHDRRVALFPGSTLFQIDEPKGKRTGRGSEPGGHAAEPAGTRRPRWIVAAEIVETSRLYARTCAKLDPTWALELGAHLVRVAHSEPSWNEAAGRVVVKRRTRLHGLELERRDVGYGDIDPVHATEIFIREGLVNDTVRIPLDFMAHNRRVREGVEDLLTRARESGYLDLDEAAYRFYARRLMPPSPGVNDGTAGGLGNPNSAGNAATDNPGQGVSSVPALVRYIRQRRETDPRFLFMSPEDLHPTDHLTVDAASFPPALPMENRVLPLNYAYKPGQPDDGVTVDVSVRDAEELTEAALDWAVPGHVAAKVEHYLRALPKELRRGFVPLAETARALASELLCASDARASWPGNASDAEPRSRSDAGRRAGPTTAGAGETLPHALAALIGQRFRVALDPAVWDGRPPPEHLRVRIRVVDTKGRELCAGRDLGRIHQTLLAKFREASATASREELIAWRTARAKWETPSRQAWTFDSTPERVLVADQGGAPVYAFPGLLAGGDGVSRRLFRSPEAASASTEAAIAAMLENELGRDLMWIQRDLRSFRQFGALAVTLATLDVLQEQAFESIRRWACDPRRVEGSEARRARTEGKRTHVADANSAWSPANSPVRDRRPDDPAGKGSVAARFHLFERARFETAVENARSELRGLVPRLTDLVREILGLRQELLARSDAPRSIHGEVEALVPPEFLRQTPFPKLSRIPRYLRAKKLRADRWRKDPARDAERARSVAPFEQALHEFEQCAARPRPEGAARRNDDAEEREADRALGRRTREAVDEFRWLVEEFRVSVFAQELGTEESVSRVKLDRIVQELRALVRGSPGVSAKPSGTEPTPIVHSSVETARKRSPLKQLSSLDKLFK